jgi:2,3-bisphosphoglycerate-dependent phosphoglycerate mutase
MTSPSSSSSLLFLRHGATALNAAGLRCGGDVDPPLTALGHRQSVQAAQRLAEMRPRVGVIVVSGLRRTRQTADIVARALQGVEIVIEPAFNERRLGEWNRRPVAETQAELEAGATPPGGEGHAEFAQRIRAGVIRTLAPRLGERPLLVASKGVARVLGELSGHGPTDALGNADIALFNLAAFAHHDPMTTLECAA